ncbi:Cytochrome c-type biogenesis protein CcmH precursor [Raoultella terrigena]|uniref:Cytochrome c-type biogenesis protein n=1 Tax=Raoultella terrigena TaxID=577 RepID=A0A4U9CUU3_RAOTE|nr:Cytochrome c-type biogenesis protein CcmH precursor [Raoultella terrigena]
MKRLLSGVMALLLSGSALGAIDTWQFKNEAQEQAFREVTSQLRCPKCQNNSIAGFECDDRRRYAAQGLRSCSSRGRARSRSSAYMVARYGNFVSYEPPLTAGTILLWLIPGLFVIVGAGVLVARARRRDTTDAALSEQERQRLAALLKKGNDA